MEHDKNSTPSAKPVNIAELRAMRDRGEKIASLTCYDASFAMVQDRAGVDFMLIGDSLGMVIHGGNTTTPVSVDDIVYHSRCVAPHLKRAFLVADLPFLSYATLDRALDSSQRLMQQGGAKMVKLEGGREQASIVEYLAVRGVPVCAHLGLQPQFVHKMGAFKVQGRDDAAAEAMIHDAHVLAEIVRLDRTHHRPVAGDSPEVEGLKLVARSKGVQIADSGFPSPVVVAPLPRPRTLWQRHGRGRGRCDPEHPRRRPAADAGARWIRIACQRVRASRETAPLVGVGRVASSRHRGAPDAGRSPLWRRRTCT